MARTFLLMSDLEAKAVGRRIQQARKEAGLTQPQFAAKLRVTPRTVQDWEGGGRIPWNWMAAIARALSTRDHTVDARYLLHGEEAGDAELDELRHRLDRMERELEEIRRRWTDPPAS